MIRKVVSVYDRKAFVFMTPFISLTIGEAVRIFEDAVKDDKTMLNKHPADYSLYHLADFDDVSGTYIPLERHVIAEAVEFLDSSASGVVHG